MQNPYSQPSRTHRRERGTVLIVTVIVVFVVAGMGLVMMTQSQNNVQRFRQEQRQAQAKFVAESAISMGIKKLNNDLLPANKSVGSLSGSIRTIHSGDDNHSPIIVEQGPTQRGHPEQDGIDNDSDGTRDEPNEDNPLVDPSDDDVESDGRYLGGIYLVEMQEWVTSSHGTKDGAKDMNDDWNDDDGDGDHTDNETGEVNAFSNDSSRKFTIRAVGAYGNYTVEMRALTNSTQTTADKYGIYSNGPVELQGKTTLDSYDSSTGNYGGGNVNDEGNVGSEGELTVKPNVTVNGSVKEWDGGGADGNPEVKGTVTGEIGTLDNDQDFDLWTLNQDYETPLNADIITSDTTLSNAEYKTLEINSGVTVTLKGGKNQEHYFGNFEAQDGRNVSPDDGLLNSGTLEIGSQSTVYIEEDWMPSDEDVIIHGPTSVDKQPTRIYVADDFTIDNKADVSIDGRVEIYVVDELYSDPKSKIQMAGGHDKATDLSVNVGGTWDDSTNPSSSDGNVNLQPKTDFKGIINAPEADVVAKPNFDFFGAIIGEDVTLKPGGAYHYDERSSKICDVLDGVNCNWIIKERNAWVVEHRGSSMPSG